jgi:CBS domain-containing protein
MHTLQSIIGDRETVIVSCSTTVSDAARLMSQRGIGGVPVLDGDRVAGIFTERDVLGRVVAAGLDPSQTAVADVMSTELVVATIDESYEACLRRMQQARVRHLLVLRDGRLAGIVSLRDLLAVELDEREEAITLLNAYVHYIPADLAAARVRTS